ncbi:MFS transporter [Candidatus Methanomassiliicoccus intestinalis]|uniref:MFS transporter n=1 Tax=Candidatus Methanomassiliicoccus intestinalis TaxID=1406512 RepID=UPI0037DBFB4A
MKKETGLSYKWIVLIVASVGSLMGPLDSTIVSVSMPSISDALQMDYAQTLWVPTAYLVTIASILLIIGRVSDIFGKKKIYISGFAIFAVGSLLCSLAQSGEQLISFRVIQGIGASFIMTSGTALVSAAFPPGEQGRALGLNVMAVYLGLAIGPPLGGILTQSFGWHSIFLVNVPIAIITIALAVWKLNECEILDKKVSFDISGAIAFAVGLITILLGLTLGNTDGWLSANVLILVIISIISFVMFIQIEQKKGENGLFDLRLFTKNRLFAAANFSAFLNYTAYYGSTFVISFYLQRVLGIDIGTTGLILLAMPLVMCIISPISGSLSDKVGSRTLATLGMIIMAVGLFLISTLGMNTSIAIVVVYLVILGIGMGMFSSPNTSAVMKSVRKDKTGVASGMLSTMRTVGQSLSLVLMGSVMAIVTSSALVSSVFMGGSSSVDNAEFITGMSAALKVSALIALIGAASSTLRGKVETETEYEMSCPK